MWEPQPEGLNQIITLLKQSQSTDNEVQRDVQMVSKENWKSRKADLSVIVGLAIF